MTHRPNTLISRFKSGAARDALCYAFAVGTMRVTSFILLPFYASVLTPSRMGQLVTAGILIILLQQVIGLGLPYALLRKYSETPTAHRKKLFASAGAVILVSWMVLSGVVSVLFLVPQNPPFGLFTSLSREIIVLCCIGGGTNAFSLLSMSYLQARKHSMLYLLISLSTVLLEAPVAIALLVAGRVSVVNLLGIEIGKQVVITLLCLLAHRRDLTLVPSRTCATGMLRFGGWVLPASLTDWLNLSTDRFILGRFGGMVAVGVYGFFYKFITPFNLFLSGYIMSVDSHYFSMNPRDGMQFVKKNIRRYTTHAGVITVCAAWGLPLVFHGIFAIWKDIPRIYLQGLPVIPLVVCGTYFYWFANHLGTILDFRYQVRDRCFIQAVACVLQAGSAAAAVLASRRLGYNPGLAAGLCMLVSFILVSAGQYRLTGPVLDRRSVAALFSVIALSCAASAAWQAVWKLID